MRALLLPLLLVPPVFAQSGALAGHEHLEYNVEWRLITAGRATVDWNGDARNGWQVGLRIESIGLVSKLFKVEDSYTARLDGGLCAQSLHLTSHEGNRERETRVTFDAESRRASYLERDRLKNTVVLATETPIPACVHDVIGGLFYLRTLNIEPGQSTQIAVSDGKRSVMGKVEAQQREDVKTPDGTFHTTRYEVFLFNGVLYKRSAHLLIWLTDDRRKLPVQLRVRMQFTIGTITLQLAKHE
jgi:hypothetical protein